MMEPQVAMVGIGLLALRLGVGLTVAAHGAQKLFGWWEGPGLGGFGGMLERLGVRPSWAWAWIAALAEAAGGLALAFGLLSPFGACAVAAAMLVAILTVHVPKGFWNRAGGYEFPLVLLSAAVALALTGPGELSLDHALGIALPEPGAVVVGGIGVIIGVAATLLSRRIGAGATQPTAT